LLCEDDRDVALIIRERLQAAGFAVDLAHTTSAAMTCATSKAYAAILTDLNLPDGDGMELVLRLRQQTRHLRTPILVVSCDAGQRCQDIQATNLNVIGCFNKPLDFESLIEVLRSSLAPQPYRRPRVLHVDDSNEVLIAVSHALTEIAEVVSAISIEDARRAIEEKRIDLVILDISLGPDSGLDLLPDLRSKNGEIIPVIIFSAGDPSLTCNEQVQVVLSKLDVSLEDLVAEIGGHLSPPKALHLREFIA
jgi:DNA-binding response OmpR family regulator